MKLFFQILVSWFNAVAVLCKNMIDSNRHIKIIITVPVLILLVIIGIFVRLPPQGNTIKNIDEVIPLLVHDGMRERGDVNTDLAKTIPPLPCNFGAVRFNLSGYMLASFLLTPEKLDEPHLRDLRFLNLVFFFATVGIFLTVCGILKLDMFAAVIGVAIICVAPGLVHDGQMARPEAFLTLAFAAFVLGLAISKRWIAYGFLVAGLGAGIAVSIKFTFLMLVIPPLYLLLHYNLKVKYCSLVSGLFLFALAVGFLIGTPYAILDFNGFLQGVRALFTQYSAGFPPHSTPDGRISLFRQVYFYLGVYGLVFISPLAGFLFARRFSANSLFLRRFFFSLACLYTVFFIVLGINPVFFERNLHPFIFLMALSSALILNAMPGVRMRMLLAVAFLVPLGIWTYMINHVQTTAHLEQVQSKIQNITNQYAGLPIIDVSLVEKKQLFGIIRQIDLGDELSRELRSSYISQGYCVVGSYISPFNCLPTSTLNTYLDQNIYVLYKPCKRTEPLIIDTDVKSGSTPVPRIGGEDTKSKEECP